MKRFIYLIAILLTIVSCQKEDPIEPIAVAPIVTAPSGGNGNANPPTPTSTKLYVGITSDFYSPIITPTIIPTVSIDNTSLTYITNNGTSNISGTPYDVILEFDIPSTLSVNCNDSIDVIVSFDTSNLGDGDRIEKIQIFYTADNKMIPAWTSYWQYDIWAPINPKVFTYNDSKVLCD